MLASSGCTMKMDTVDLNNLRHAVFVSSYTTNSNIYRMYLHIILEFFLSKILIKQGETHMQVMTVKKYETIKMVQQ